MLFPREDAVEREAGRVVSSTSPMEFAGVPSVEEGAELRRIAGTTPIGDWMKGLDEADVDARGTMPWRKVERGDENTQLVYNGLIEDQRTILYGFGGKSARASHAEYTLCIGDADGTTLLGEVREGCVVAGVAHFVVGVTSSMYDDGNCVGYAVRIESGEDFWDRFNLFLNKTSLGSQCVLLGGEGQFAELSIQTHHNNETKTIHLGAEEGPYDLERICMVIIGGVPEAYVTVMLPDPNAPFDPEKPFETLEEGQAALAGWPGLDSRGGRLQHAVVGTMPVELFIADIRTGDVE